MTKNLFIVHKIKSKNLSKEEKPLTFQNNSVLLYYAINTIIHQNWRKEDFMPWTLSNKRPIYLQLMEQIKLQILAGTYESGNRFPTVRELAAEAAVNPNTMQKALAALEQEGLLVGSRTSGRTVTTDQSLIRSMREELAGQELDHFRHAMSELGFSDDEIMAYIMKEYQL